MVGERALPGWPPAELGEGLCFVNGRGEIPFSAERPGAAGRLSLCSLRRDVLLPRRDTVPLPRVALLNPVLGNGSTQADPVIGVLGWFLLYFSQHLVGPAQRAGFLSGRCPSYHCLILHPVPSGSSERSAVPTAPAAAELGCGFAVPARGTQPLSALELDTAQRFGKAASNTNPSAARLKYITV